MFHQAPPTKLEPFPFGPSTQSKKSVLMREQYHCVQQEEPVRCTELRKRRLKPNKWNLGITEFRRRAMIECEQSILINEIDRSDSCVEAQKFICLQIKQNIIARAKIELQSALDSERSRT